MSEYFFLDRMGEVARSVTEALYVLDPGSVGNLIDRWIAQCAEARAGTAGPLSRITYLCITATREVGGTVRPDTDGARCVFHGGWYQLLQTGPLSLGLLLHTVDVVVLSAEAFKEGGSNAADMLNLLLAQVPVLVVDPPVTGTSMVPPRPAPSAPANPQRVPVPARLLSGPPEQTSASVAAAVIEDLTPAQRWWVRTGAIAYRSDAIVQAVRRLGAQAARTRANQQEHEHQEALANRTRRIAALTQELAGLTARQQHVTQFITKLDTERKQLEQFLKSVKAADQAWAARAGANPLNEVVAHVLSEARKRQLEEIINRILRQRLAPKAQKPERHTAQADGGVADKLVGAAHAMSEHEQHKIDVLDPAIADLVRIVHRESLDAAQNVLSRSLTAFEAVLAEIPSAVGDEAPERARGRPEGRSRGELLLTARSALEGTLGRYLNQVLERRVTREIPVHSLGWLHWGMSVVRPYKFPLMMALLAAGGVQQVRGGFSSVFRLLFGGVIVVIVGAIIARIFYPSHARHASETLRRELSQSNLEALTIAMGSMAAELTKGFAEGLSDAVNAGANGVLEQLKDQVDRLKQSATTTTERLRAENAAQPAAAPIDVRSPLQDALRSLEQSKRSLTSDWASYVKFAS